MELSDEDDHRVIQSIHLRDKDHSDEVKGRLCEAFQIDEEGVVFKVGHTGSKIVNSFSCNHNTNYSLNHVLIDREKEIAKSDFLFTFIYEHA